MYLHRLMQVYVYSVVPSQPQNVEVKARRTLEGHDIVYTWSAEDTPDYFIITTCLLYAECNNTELVATSNYTGVGQQEVSETSRIFYKYKIKKTPAVPQGQYEGTIMGRKNSIEGATGYFVFSVGKPITPVSNCKDGKSMECLSSMLL